MELLSIKGFNMNIGYESKISDGSFSISSGDVLLLTGPNGCGKSTIIKILMGAAFDYNGLEFSAKEALFLGKYKVLDSEKGNETFRRSVCYVSQEDEFESDDVLDCFVNSIDYSIKDDKEKYVFEFIKQFAIYDCFDINVSDLHLDRKSKKIIKAIKIDENMMSIEDKKTIKFLTLNTKRMSGGQKKLINIFSNLVRYGFCNLVILDEPLNNLDYNNVRTFSNVLTKIYKSKPEIAILLITHCRSIPIVNRVITIDTVKKALIEEPMYICNSCFGKTDENGMYI